MTKNEIQKEIGIRILLSPEEGNRKLSLEEELSYKKTIQMHKKAFDEYFTDDDSGDVD